jgi:chromosome segregation ATPase
MGDITNSEKDRRSSKKMYENLDSALADLLDDKKFLVQYLKDLHKNSPSAFNQLMTSRLPKVQPIDQDLQKTLISLKAMLLDLPEVDDIAGALKKRTAERNNFQRESENKDAQIKLLNKKLAALREECQTK